MTREEIIAADEATLALARHHAAVGGIEELSPAHLGDMMRQMRDPAFSIGKLNRWLGWMQAAVVAGSCGKVTLADMKEINRPKDPDLGLVQSPAQAAEAVCHDEQMTVWVDEIAGDLSMGGYLRDDLTYDEALAAGATISHALRRIIGAAFTHPELAALSAEGSATIAAADPPTPQRRQADMATDYNDWKSLLDGRFWLEMREPGKVPQRKGSWPLSMLKETLREFMKANPAAMISVVTISHDGPCFDDAPEALAVLDVRTRPTGKKHIASSNAAHAAFASEDRRVEDMRERAAKVADEHAAKSNGAVIRIVAKRIASAIRCLSVQASSSPEDQQKATATPTIADPDGEVRS